MKTDIEIAQACKLLPIEKIAQKAGFRPEEIELHGKFKAKINLFSWRKRWKNKDGKLILVTTMTPTPKGEGKTTVTIGLGQALSKIGKKTMICIREPSLGPVMGMKGGAAGGGYSQVLPMDEINLHFVGDFNAVACAHNLLAAMLDNHIYQGNSLKIDLNRIVWPRVVDMNDRALRSILINGTHYTRSASFDITASSEVMAILCLSESLEEMKERLGRIIVAYNIEGDPIYCRDLKAQGAMALLLKDAIKPNLVQSIEGVPAFVHGGPFANIAHGCNSLIATKLALKMADYVVTEAGFGTDLGAEKFFDIKVRTGELHPNLVVLVVTIKALLHQGSGDLKQGFKNLKRHIEGLKLYGVPLLVAVNLSTGDKNDDVAEIKSFCEKMNCEAIEAKVWEQGGRGGRVLAQKAVRYAIKAAPVVFNYDLDDPIELKIEKVAKRIYGASGLDFSPQAHSDIEQLNCLGFDKLPICIAKTQYSFSDDAKKLGAPENFKIRVQRLKALSGAGFVVVFTGEILTMPGLPKNPAAENMDVAEDGKITGLF